MKTLYISDLDGTLLHPDVNISARSKDIINQLLDRGVLFSVATARTIASAKHILKDLNLTLPIVLMNGVCIYDLVKKDYIKVETIPKSSINALLDVIENNNLKGFLYTIKDGNMSTYYEDLDSKPLYQFYKERVNLYQKPFTKIDRFRSLEDEPVIYFSFMDRKERLEPIYQIIEKIPSLNCTFYKDNYIRDNWFLEAFSNTASKFHAVKYLRSYLQVDQIVCFGDNRNDLPLFQASDYKLAVGNAVDELKQKADLVIGKNTDNGVAIWLDQNVIL